jgi:hypothetical protein
MAIESKQENARGYDEATGRAEQVLIPVLLAAIMATGAIHISYYQLNVWNAIALTSVIYYTAEQCASSCR